MSRHQRPNVHAADHDNGGVGATFALYRWAFSPATRSQATECPDTVFDDPFSIVAAVAGGAAGIWLMTRFGGFRVSPKASIPTSQPLPRPTGYAPPRSPTASPILTACGLAVIGVGLVLAPSTGVLSFVLIVPGGGLLLAAALGWLRGGTVAAPGGGTAGDEGSDRDKPQ